MGPCEAESAKDSALEDGKLPDRELDAIDLKILRELQRDGRLTNQDLAKKVGLSQSPCLRRVRRLERAGIVKRYVA
ncbi:MAG: winged helix-turn-helix transcriptional regulator, partial [Rhodospirillaceae bacterium]|nr:winged helix-turn-helix transcriptional regulator [Rhodospirillaceae bacterium]